MKLPCLDGTNPYYLSPYCLTEIIVTGLSGNADAWQLRPALPAPLRGAPCGLPLLHADSRGVRKRARRRSGGGAGRSRSRHEVVVRRGCRTIDYSVRRKWEPFLFDQFSMDVSDALCVADERLNPVSIAVVVPKGKEPPRSRSVVNKLANVDKRK